MACGCCVDRWWKRCVAAGFGRTSEKMSRLVFQEELLSDHEVSYDTEEDVDEEVEDQKRGEAMSDNESESDDSEDRADEKRAIKERNAEYPGEREKVEDESDQGDQAEQSHKNEFQELESDSEDEEFENLKDQATIDVNLNGYSSFLSKFLATKKTPQVPPPPVVIPLNDFILREFALSEKSKHLKRSREDRDEGKEEEEEEEDNISSDGDALRMEQEGNEENLLPEEAIPFSHCLTIFNLPYNMTVKEIEAISSFYGIKNVTAKINIDKKTNRPSGSAQIFLQPQPQPSKTRADDGGTEQQEEGEQHEGEDSGLYLKSVIDALDGKDFRGRAVRVRSFESNGGGARGGRASFGGGASRYFGGDDLSVKCYNCGQVGHRQTDCLQEPTLPPCHFCAGTDHEPQNCSNIACFRCSNFGHHSRNCSNSRASKPILCSFCGSFSHDKRFCPLSPIEARERLESPRESILCMCCGKYGHVMCLTLPMPSNRTVYCPSCGISGHNADYVRDQEQEPSCKYPDQQRYRRRIDDSHSHRSFSSNDHRDQRGGGSYGYETQSNSHNSVGGGSSGGRRYESPHGGRHRTQQEQQQSSQPPPQFPPHFEGNEKKRSHTYPSHSSRDHSNGSGERGNGRGNGRGGDHSRSHHNPPYPTQGQGRGQSEELMTSRTSRVVSNSSSGSSDRPGGSFSRGGGGGRGQGGGARGGGGSGRGRGGGGRGQLEGRIIHR